MINAHLSALHPIGTIIHTTVCDTMAKVVETYGGTTWIQHTGYVLRGADSGVTADNAVKDGGSDDLIVPYHNHSVNAASITTGSGLPSAWGITNGGSTGLRTISSGDYITSGVAVGAGQFAAGYKVYNHSHSATIPAHNTNYAGTDGNAINANIPNYKSVYIWERTA